MIFKKSLISVNSLQGEALYHPPGDASINRIAVWVIGLRSVPKALLFALLLPDEKRKQLQDSGSFTEKMVVTEEIKTLPFGEVRERMR
ncbi:MAG: L-rhamnose isomerase [Spirochaetaceae bacterium]|nr:L-rhamnose isomerase [Spirochaetaceae bacterium]